MRLCGPLMISRFALALTLTASLFCSPLVADDWPQWMGPKRDGVWRETGILEKFPADGPKVLWRTPIGSGYSGPAVAAGKVFITDRVVEEGAKVPDDPFQRTLIPGTERVFCLDEDTGEIVWTHEYDCPYSVSYPLGPRATPTVDGDKVYTLGAEGDLYCLGTGSGEVYWSRQLKKDYGTEAPMWGFSAHPLVDGNKLISVVGGKGSIAVAFDKQTGKEIWRALSAKESGYCPPTIIEAGGKRQLLIWHAESVNSLDPETGKEYWSVPIEAAYGMAIAAPQKVGDQLFLASYQDQSMMLKLDESKPAASVAWRGERKTSMYPAMATPFFEGEYIYGPCANGEFRCIRAASGERLWETFAPTTNGRRAKWGNAFVVKNGDRFFLANEQGDLIIAKLSPKGYEEVDRTHLLEPTSAAGGREIVWSHPAYADKSVFARNDKEIVRVSLAAPSGE